MEGTLEVETGEVEGEYQMTDKTLEFVPERLHVIRISDPLKTVADEPLIVEWNDKPLTERITIQEQQVDIVTTMSTVHNWIFHNADRKQSIIVGWYISMSYGMYWRITQLWPCNYLTDQCTSAILNGNFMLITEQIKMRDRMRNTQSLFIMGLMWPVIFSDPDDHDITFILSEAT